MALIDEMNYANDPRVRNAGKNKAPTVWNDDGQEIELPSKWMVCPTCQGKGTHVNPSIDSGGLVYDDRADLEFVDDYMAGNYDVQCSQCEGRTTVLGIDFDRMSADERRMWDEQVAQERMDHDERMGEIRAGC